MTVDMRVGSAEFDNRNFSGGFASSWQSSIMPIYSTPALYQRNLWLLCDEAYKNAVEEYAEKIAAFPNPETQEGLEAQQGLGEPGGHRRAARRLFFAIALHNYGPSVGALQRHGQCRKGRSQARLERRLCGQRLPIRSDTQRRSAKVGLRKDPNTGLYLGKSTVHDVLTRSYMVPTPRPQNRRSAHCRR